MCVKFLDTETVHSYRCPALRIKWCAAGFCMESSSRARRSVQVSVEWCSCRCGMPVVLLCAPPAWGGFWCSIPGSTCCQHYVIVVKSGPGNWVMHCAFPGRVNILKKIWHCGREHFVCTEHISALWNLQVSNDRAECNQIMLWYNSWGSQCSGTHL